MAHILTPLDLLHLWHSGLQLGRVALHPGGVDRCGAVRVLTHRTHRRSSMTQHPRSPRMGMNRRTFLQYSTGAGLTLGAGSLLPARWGGPAEGKPRSGPPRTELRTYLFNFTHLDTSQHDLILVAGKQRV